MLRLMLAAHPNIGIPPEGGFIVRLGWKYGHLREFSNRTVERFVDDLFALETTQDWNFDKDKLLSHLQELAPCSFSVLINGVYQEYLRRVFPGKERWGDKTTWYLDYLPQINRYFPQAKFIHIIRDGRAVAASFKRVPHLSSDVQQAALEWHWSVGSIIRFGKRVGTDRYIEIRYEELVEKPEELLHRICKFLQEPYSSKILAFWDENRERRLEPSRHLEWKELTLHPITKSQILKWQEELSSKEISELWAIAGKTMGRCGYRNEGIDDSATESYKIRAQSIKYQVVRVIKKRLRPLLHYSKAAISNKARL